MAIDREAQGAKFVSKTFIIQIFSSSPHSICVNIKYKNQSMIYGLLISSFQYYRCRKIFNKTICHVFMTLRGSQDLTLKKQLQCGSACEYQLDQYDYQMCKLVREVEMITVCNQHRSSGEESKQRLIEYNYRLEPICHPCQKTDRLESFHQSPSCKSPRSSNQIHGRNKEEEKSVRRVLLTVVLSPTVSVLVYL